MQLAGSARLYLASRVSLATAALLILLATWPAIGLFGREPWKADEAYSFGLVWSMSHGKGWIVPLLAGEPFVEKPPLFYWTAAALAIALRDLLPEHEAARLACALYIVLALAFVGAAGRHANGERGALRSMLVLITSVGLFDKVHMLVTDVALLAGFAIALWGLGECRTCPGRGGIALGIGSGVAFMAKGLLGPGILGLTALALCAFGPWRQRSYRCALALAALAFAPFALGWPALLYARSPPLFVEWLWRNNFGRFFGFAQLGEHHQRLFYLTTLPWFAFPGWLLALPALRAMRRREIAVAPLLPSMLALAIALAVLVAADESRSIYACVLLVPLAPIAAAGVPILSGRAMRALRLAATCIFPLAIAALWLAWLASISGVSGALVLPLLSRYPDFVWQFSLPATIAAATATLLCVVVWRATRDGAEHLLWRWAAGSTAFWMIVCTLWLPFLDYGMSYRGVVGEMIEALPDEHGCVASRALGEPQRAMLQYYAELTTRRVEVEPQAARCDLLLRQYVGPAADAPAPGWELFWEGARPGDRKERFALYRRVP